MQVYESSKQTLKSPPHPRSVDAFCERQGICRASFYNLVKRGEAPNVIRIGVAVRITEESETEWMRSRSVQHVPAVRGVPNQRHAS